MRELLSYGKIPYAGMRNAQVITKIGEGYRMSCPEGCPEEIYQLMLKCWDEEPAKRYSFTELSNIIDSWTAAYQEPVTIMTETVIYQDKSEEYNN
jgi:hypothetical protein